MMQHLFKAWRAFSTDCRAASHVLLLSDYDGTLTSIVGRPEDAVLSASARQKLQALARKTGISVGVISGRQLAELKGLVAIEGIYYAGNHGLEIEGPGISYVSPEAGTARPVIAELAAQLTEALENVAGVIIQEKGFSVSVHYRLVKPEDEDAVAEAVQQITAPHIDKGEIKVYPMKKVWEIRPPVDWDKGKAVVLIGQKIKDALKLNRLLTIYLGDDTTDEDAFRVLRRPDGWSVFVSGEKASSSADYYLNSVAEVEEFLARLIQLK
jgi:trehalose 6-phosphate phosphatase